VTVHCIGPPVTRCPCLIRIAPAVDGSLAFDKESDGDALYLHSHSPARPVARGREEAGLMVDRHASPFRVLGLYFVILSYAEDHGSDYNT
jgi:hypothetical protein